jgi:hypothetical protein
MSPLTGGGVSHFASGCQSTLVPNRSIPTSDTAIDRSKKLPTRACNVASQLPFGNPPARLLGCAILGKGGVDKLQRFCAVAPAVFEGLVEGVKPLEGDHGEQGVSWAPLPSSSAREQQRTAQSTG